ncbi:hypothetical protein NDU88_010343 [Pleurodeles waltl]|uniref:Uncharacterized protein n=1 Tax=Pleurodeles waltl TaxID=8319 RepID=A0AAV7QXR8_PLEWA|nr:hypothetical protein NDU88_010343 [Pleurodeles waltl]
MKKNDGLRAGGALEEETAGEDVSAERRRKREPERRPPTEEPKKSSVKDTATREEVPEGRELRHVPGGTWLNQGNPRRLPSPVKRNPGKEEHSVELRANRPHTLDIVTDKLNILKTIFSHPD